ncbi:MAG: hypothetical protein AAFR12_17765 [Cyanobacteria bacterium J06626_6]
MPTVISMASVPQTPGHTSEIVPVRLVSSNLSRSSLSINQLTSQVDDVIQGRLQDYLRSYLENGLWSELQMEPPNSFTAVLQEIAIAYGNTCALVWTLALTKDGARAAVAEPLQASVNALCMHWMRGKRAYPEADFFSEAKTLGALRSKWQQPAIQSSLRQTTLRLQRGVEGQWIARYPTCWAYAVGRTMYQLLQWNHQLTAQTLRECWRLNETPLIEG